MNLPDASFSEVEILLVEDNPLDAELAMRALQKNHLANRLVWLKDGAEALAYLFGTDGSRADAAPPPRVILLDLKLPKVDGHVVLARLKTDQVLRHTPVVVLTSSREESDVLRSYDLGVNSYIVKPVDFDSFAEAVKTLGMYWLLMNQFPGRPPEPRP
jgi:two-component system, response regulator